MHGQMWGMGWEHVLALEEELEDAVQPFKEAVDRLRTVPGVGPITAATYVAVLGTPHRFPDSRHVVSYLGLAPSTYDSGERQRHGHITKRGASELRTLLCEVAHQAASAKHPLNPYFTRLMVRQGYRKALVAIAQRLARILYQVWRNEEDFDVRRLNVTPGVHTRTRMCYYRLGKQEERPATQASVQGTVHDQ
jgi:transposase